MAFHEEKFEVQSIVLDPVPHHHYKPANLKDSTDFRWLLWKFQNLNTSEMATVNNRVLTEHGSVEPLNMYTVKAKYHLT